MLFIIRVEKKNECENFDYLKQGLKNHAVTMFEVGKLCDESLDSFLGELEKVSLLDAEGEGEVSRYFAHAVSFI